ncbi:hypothetical protein CDD83_7385 [Cordyceps sp. RAO-2017]|nr:hypothetical protein CDD83_7385 [Cordyceps sp. RAO-2017]
MEAAPPTRPGTPGLVGSPLPPGLASPVDGVWQDGGPQAAATLAFSTRKLVRATIGLNKRHAVGVGHVTEAESTRLSLRLNSRARCGMTVLRLLGGTGRSKREMGALGRSAMEGRAVDLEAWAGLEQWRERWCWPIGSRHSARNEGARGR